MTEESNMKTHQVRNTLVLLSAILSGLIAQADFGCETNPTMTGLENATYTGIEDGPVTLSNGHWEGSPYTEGGASRPRVGLLQDILITGDLDADGTSDPMCCPTQLATRTWTLNGTQLEEQEMGVTGQLSLSVLEGSDWLLTRMDKRQSLPGDVEVSLSFAAGRISGRSACNRYSANITEGDNPGEILIGPTMGTRMACEEHLMEIESLYLKALAEVISFSFHSGKLALNGLKEDGTPFSLLFISTGVGPRIEL